MSRAQMVYSRLPVPLQNVACTAYGISEAASRFGPRFAERFEWLKTTENASRTEIETYQDTQVARIVEHAFNTVPYYRNIMRQRGLTPADFRVRSDLKKLPILTKELVRQHKQELLSTVAKKRDLVPRKTSGTTGSALSFYATRDSVAFQWAVWWRHRSRFGACPRDRHLNFTGKPVVPASQTRPPFWRWNLRMNQALVSMQHLRPDRIPDIVDFASRQSFKYYSGYPSLLHSYARIIDELSIEIDAPPRNVFLGAEPTSELQRATIARVLNTNVTDQYGFSEGCGNASRCEHGVYHEDWEFGYIEPGGTVGDDIGDPSHKILATGFANAGFPFIRYDVGDSATWASDDYACSCGRQSRVLRSIDGRNEDYIRTPEGATVKRFDYLFKDTNHVSEAQVVQVVPGRITIRVVPVGHWSDDDADLIRSRVREYVSESLKVEFEVTDSIERSPSGKFRAVVSSIKDSGV